MMNVSSYMIMAPFYRKKYIIYAINTMSSNTGLPLLKEKRHLMICKTYFSMQEFISSTGSVDKDSTVYRMSRHPPSLGTNLIEIKDPILQFQNSNLSYLPLFSKIRIGVKGPTKHLFTRTNSKSWISHCQRIMRNSV